LTGRRDLHGLMPREHGSWAYLLIPQLAALIAARHPISVLTWLVGTLLMFAALQGFAAAQRRRERWSAAGLICALAGAAILLLASRERPAALALLIPSAVPVGLALFATRGRIGRNDGIEVLGIVCASILGCGGLILAGGSDHAGALLAVVSCAYSLLSLIWVRVRLASALRGRRPLLPHGWNIPASLLILGLSAVAGVALDGFVSGLLPGIYLGRSLLPVPRRRDGLVSVTTLGVQEAVSASVFAVGVGLFLPP